MTHRYVTPLALSLIASSCLVPASFATETRAEREAKTLAALNAEVNAKAPTQTANSAGTASLNSTQPVVYIVEQSLPDFLRQAARRSGYQITLSPRVRGTLKKLSLPLNLEAILKEISPQFDLKWHFQQQQAYVSVSSESQTRLIFLGGMSMKNLKDSLKGAGLKTDAYDLSYVEESNSVIVNAPASYIASIELIAESFNKNKAVKKQNIKIIKFGNVTKPEG